MRIGIDARTIQGRHTGDGTYWRGLIEGLSRVDSENDYIIYFDARIPQPEIALSASMRVRILAAVTGRMWSAWSFPRALREDGVQLAHVQYTVPPAMPCPVVTTVHDVSFKRLPEYFNLKDRLILDLGMRQADRKAARIIAVSEYTKSEIVSLYGIHPDRIDVTYEGADERFKPMDRDIACEAVKEKYGLKCQFVLTVGVIQPRKNFPRLLEGFAKFKSLGQSEHKLIVAGKYGWKESGLNDLIEKLGITREVVFAGYVPHGDLPIFYNTADLFVYPSVYEGFGLPPLEAMSCGTPVITGNRSSLPEVVGEAGIMVDPYDPGAFGDAISRVLSSESLRTDMSARGLEQAKKFSWDKMARQTVDVYRKAAGK